MFWRFVVLFCQEPSAGMDLTDDWEETQQKQYTTRR